jgi:hypothetical protein
MSTKLRETHKPREVIKDGKISADMIPMEFLRLVQNITDENLKVVWAEFSTLS